MGLLSRFFKPSKKEFYRHYVSMMAHMKPFAEFVKDEGNLQLTIVGSNDNKPIELAPYYDTWANASAEQRENVLLEIVSKHL